jgi:hypothetical protein
MTTMGSFMSLTIPDKEELKKLIKDRVENYPDLDAMVASGDLIRRSGSWYEPRSAEAFNAVIQYAKGVRVAKDGRSQIQVGKQSKRLVELAKKI